ncbi:MAG TPA: MmcQ/YjbR family DNA-binding protein [Steroidobacteraceae bacterium]|nr:MmcQ/YjbR family DNA-binding protein [Steroidobacteraceae bacterium]
MKLGVIRNYALSLPETTEEPHHQFSSYRVRKKIFVTIPPEEDRIHAFVTEHCREQALALYADFVEKLHWGGKVVGIKIILQRANASAVKDLVLEAWKHKAPKALLAGLKTVK